ncbi:anthranilate phosphoribosyltransferase [Chloroflexota bacterium]
MIKEALGKLVDGRSLTEAEASGVMAEIMAGQVTGAQFGAFVTALRLKGETVDEITGLARVMRANAVPVKVAGTVVDTCGTGGDGTGTFNISTVTALVAAGGGIKVAKHGNRAMSSHCGSADLLEALGVKIDLRAEAVARCIEEVGIGFMFAPGFHPAMKHAAMPRREIGFRTVFNFLGPLTNPAGATVQVLGVADAAMAEKLAEVLVRLGTGHTLVVHGDDGLDEITLSGITRVYEASPCGISRYEVAAVDFKLPSHEISELRGSSAEENAGIARSILDGTMGAHRDVVLANAGAVFFAAGKVNNLKEGVFLAADVIDSGKARQVLDKFITTSNSLAG